MDPLPCTNLRRAVQTAYRRHRNAASTLTDLIVRMLTTLLLVLPTLGGCDKLPGSDRPRTAFDASAAMTYTKAQLAFGPRVPGTPGHGKAGDWIVAMMRQRADTVIEQRFTHRTLDGKELPLRNVLARFNPAATQRVLYITHWDTRPTADDDRVLGNRDTPIPGANDGAAGVGLFVALGDALKKARPTIGVDLLFTDGEDYGKTFDPPYADVLLGSQYFAEHLPAPGYRPMYGVLWDMIADKDLNIYQEELSVRQAPEVVSRVWQKAKELGYAKYFIPEAGGPVTDDHVPLLAKGLRVIDVIDYDYGPPAPNGYHHTLQDTIDKISTKSFQIVGDVALSLLSDF